MAEKGSHGERVGGMRIRLGDERRRDIREALERLFREEFDESLSEFRAQRLVEFFVQALGPPVYNQAIQDARGFLLERLEDLDAEFYVPED